MEAYNHFLWNLQLKMDCFNHNSRASRNFKRIPNIYKYVDYLVSYAKNSKEKKPTLQELKIIDRIRSITSMHNRNNITRTEAYRQMYFQHPELHWAFLAHMVSRNGGWCMTDIKGNLMSKLLTEEEEKSFYQFFERANALIFYDAYPQLLLYEECKKQNRNLFHLLPALHVSSFMRPFWECFLMQRSSELLTVALIINEQHYIENRIIKATAFQKHVLNTYKFKEQQLLQMSQVIFPYWMKNNKNIRLAGSILEHFADITERIESGKQLYAILFGIQDVFEGAVRFASEIKHTGSRADYWEKLYSKKKLKEKRHYYSPELENVWKDYPFILPEKFDWFANVSPAASASYFKAGRVPFRFDMTGESYFRLNKLELAVQMKKYIK
ncbi:DUF2515 family protein [Alteribacillus sp. HJP-4]|uniref:DUF2515 family protein n=1 Tax=Alteribacillus sp. HJP-4 TaxID=2775394 RepID=UPI0035CD1C28